MNLPNTENLLLDFADGVLKITLNRPQAKNALSLAMVEDILAAFDAAKNAEDCRVIVLRGSEGNFCAGGDIKDMAKARSVKSEDGSDPIAALNRRFGEMLLVANAAPQAVIAILEGAVLGGGFGLACVSDVAIASRDAKFGLPETSLGIPPAQIAPFVVQRIGITQARRLGLTGPRFNGEEAFRLGLVHYVEDDASLIEERLDEVLASIRRCAPGANAVTKQIMMNVTPPVTDAMLDEAAEAFSQAVQSPEGMEGTMAFVQKRKASWAE